MDFRVEKNGKMRPAADFQQKKIGLGSYFLN
jgi:hypothetical protein